MRKNQVQSIILHIGSEASCLPKANRVSQFHSALIERRLASANLSPAEKIAVLDQIIENLKSREQNGIIQ